MTPRGFFVTLVGVLCLVPLLLFAALPASAATSATLNPKNASPGQMVALTVAGFASGESIVVRGFDTTLGTIQAGLTGGGQLGFQVPMQAQPGPYQITATGQTSGTASDTLTVGVQATASPTTGSSPTITTPTQTPPPLVSTVLNPNAALPLEMVQLSLVGARAGERIEVTGFSRLLGTLFADSQGRAQFSFQVPADTQPGAQPIDVRGEMGGIVRASLIVRELERTAIATATQPPAPTPTPLPSATPVPEATPVGPAVPGPFSITLFHDSLGQLEPLECPAEGACSQSFSIPAEGCGATGPCEMVTMTLCGQGTCSTQLRMEPCGGLAESCTSEPFDLACEGSRCTGRLPSPTDPDPPLSFFDVFLELPDLSLRPPVVGQRPDGPVVLVPGPDETSTMPVEVETVCECENVQIVSQGRQMLLYDSSRRRVTLNFRVGWAITCSEGQIVDCHGQIGVDWSTGFPAAEVPAVFTIQCDGQICNGSTVGQQDLELILSDESVGFTNGWPSAPNWSNKSVTYTFTRTCLNSTGATSVGTTALTINFDRMGHPRRMIERTDT